MHASTPTLRQQRTARRPHAPTCMPTPPCRACPVVVRTAPRCKAEEPAGCTKTHVSPLIGYCTPPPVPFPPRFPSLLAPLQTPASAPHATSTVPRETSYTGGVAHRRRFTALEIDSRVWRMQPPRPRTTPHDPVPVPHAFKGPVPHPAQPRSPPPTLQRRCNKHPSLHRAARSGPRPHGHGAWSLPKPSTSEKHRRHIHTPQHATSLPCTPPVHGSQLP